MLTPPADLAALEAQWHEVFPLDKPMLIEDQPPFEAATDPWSAEHEARWSSFLERHPEALDSLEILDDLASAATVHPDRGTRAFAERVQRPLLERAFAIIERALAEAPADTRIEWIVGPNRSALRPLERLVALELRSGNRPRAIAIAELMVRLNPTDNHGLRALLVNHYLRGGEDQRALELCERYPDDIDTSIAFGRLLALYRLGRIEEAETELAELLPSLRKIVRALINPAQRRPHLSEGPGVIVGSAEEAWYYRQEMRRTWQDTPGALAWLKTASRRLT